MLCTSVPVRKYKPLLVSHFRMEADKTKLKKKTNKKPQNRQTKKQKTPTTTKTKDPTKQQRKPISRYSGLKCEFCSSKVNICWITFNDRYEHLFQEGCWVTDGSSSFTTKHLTALCALAPPVFFQNITECSILLQAGCKCVTPVAAWWLPGAGAASF